MSTCSLKYSAIITLVCLSITIRAMELCSDPNCVCRNDDLICNCKNRNELKKNYIKNKAIKNIEFHNCGKVTLGYDMFFRLNLTSLLFSNLERLIIDQAAVFNLNDLDSLTFEHIASFEAQPMAVYITSNVGTLTLRNVTSTSFAESFLVTPYLKELIIVDSNIGTIVFKAFNIFSIEKFIMSGNRIGLIESLAIKTNNPVQEISIFNNHFGLTKTNALVFFEAVKLSIFNCTFGQLDSNFVRSTVEFFYFNGNVIGLCESNAFSYLNVKEKAIFENNLFLETKTNCLPRMIKNDKHFSAFASITEIRNNSFTCKCDLSWIWKQSYRNFFESGECIEPGMGRLTDLIPKLNKLGICQELIDKNDINYRSAGNETEVSDGSITTNVPGAIITNTSPFFFVVVLAMCSLALGIIGTLVAKKVKRNITRSQR